MSAVAPYLDDARVLDLFAGSGALGLEALSRGAASATFVDDSAAALRVLTQNVATLGAGDRVTVVKADAIHWADALGRDAFDVVFADPPYGKGLAARLAERFAAVPFAGLLCIEHGRGDVLPELPGSRTRRYGDSHLTFIPAPS